MINNELYFFVCEGSNSIAIYEGCVLWFFFFHVILRVSFVSGFRGYEGVESKEAWKDKEATG